ncbi:MAG: Uma2 family endonuclease [Pyrinomonadaceae bacterium]|nr:Uma2 family endonuclease [Pyrinomonadaceae bacterium]
MPVSLNQILEMPNAAILAEQIQTALEREKAEREHFYKIIDENKKMEFINGEIFFQSPVKIEHNQATKRICILLNTFVDTHDLGFVGIEKILISLTRNDYEPDVCFFGKAKSEKFKAGQMQFPAPDLAVEVLSDSTEKHDRETKFADYAAHGVTEYWIVDAKKEVVEQYVLPNDRYELLVKSGNGEIESVVLENFKIPIRAIFDKQTNLETLKSLI